MARNLSTSRDETRIFGFLTAYDEQVPDGDTLNIPEDLTTLSDDDLAALTEQAQAAFDALYGDGTGFTPEDIEQMQGLRDGLLALNAEAETRQTAAAERDAAAAAMAAEVRGPEDTEGDPEADPEAPAEDPEAETPVDPEAPAEETPAEEQPEAEALAAGARGPVSVNLSSIRSRQASRRPAPARGEPTTEPSTMRDVVFAAATVDGFSAGDSLDFTDMARIMDRRAGTMNEAAYRQANDRGQHLREQFAVATIRKPFRPELVINSDDPEHVESVLRYATDERNTPGGSLVASGGWCAPSETVYDLFELETSDGIISLPEVSVRRGGLRWSQGPDFATLFAAIGFSYTEAEDIAGDYDGAGGGSKPCYKVDCPDFEEERLNLDGVCITAGLLQNRGYPEVTARTIRGGLVVHQHKMAASKITALVAGSDAVSLTANQVGATAPILTGIEVQVLHYRSIHRMSRNATLEAIFPHWVHGAIRADLARRQGVDLIDVPDTRINAWFAQRGVAPQFVYNWQGIDSVPASGRTSFPTSVQFLLYAAGTWAIGSSDVITLDTVYDSVLLGTNDFTALFTEEGWLAAKRGHDSRVVTVPICTDGATHIGVDIACTGAAAS